jgi:hypothetical protein
MKFWENFPKISQFYFRNKKNQFFFQFFCECANHNGNLEKKRKEKGFNKRNNDHTKRIESNENGMI